MQIKRETRRSILDSILSKDRYTYYGNLDLLDFLKRVWDLNVMPSTDYRFQNAEGDICQHMINNNDWDNYYLLFNYLNLIGCEDAIFLQFLENCLHPTLKHEEDTIVEMYYTFNKYLVEDGYKLVDESKLSGKSVFKAIKISDLSSDRTIENSYEVVLSFAGEDRDYVEEVAAYLTNKGIKIFYDKNEEVTLWGKDLAAHFDEIYRNMSKYCVVFISRHYANKAWTKHERRSALARALEERGEYILPVRFDDTDISGIPPTIGYIDASRKSPDQLGVLILKKLGGLHERSMQA